MVRSPLDVVNGQLTGAALLMTADVNNVSAAVNAKHSGSAHLVDALRLPTEAGHAGHRNLSHAGLPRLLRLKGEGRELGRKIARQIARLAADCCAANAFIDGELWPQCQALQAGSERDFLEWRLIRCRAVLRTLAPSGQHQWAADLEHLISTADTAAAEWLHACLSDYLDHELQKDADKVREIRRQLGGLNPWLERRAS